MQIGFPRDIARLICEYSAVWTVLSWVEKCAPKSAPGEDDNFVPCEASYVSYVCANPLAHDLISTRDFDIAWDNMSRNPANWALDLLNENSEMIDPAELCRNTNPRMLKLLMRIDKEYWDNGYLLANPVALGLFENGISKVNLSWIMWNQNAEKLISAHKIPIDYSALGGNSSEWAIEILKKYTGDKHWPAMCANQHPWAIAQLRANTDKICWYNLSANPAALDILMVNQNNITIEIWENPAIFAPSVPIGLEDIIMSL